VMATALLLLDGCGKGNLRQGELMAPMPSAHHRAPSAQRRGHVPIPLRLDAARAAAFASAVNLKAADVTGSKVTPRSRDPEQENEAEKCGAGGSAPVGGGSSPKLDRGTGLEHEAISSSIVVLPSPKLARADFSYASSKAGLACYGKALSKSLEGEASAGVQLGHLRLQKLKLTGTEGVQSSGIRISARVSSTSSSLSVGLYIDAVGFLYGPAEIQIYATSFVQPEPLRTEQELLGLLDQRALLNRL